MKEQHEHASLAETSLVLSTLEHDQLVAAKKEPVPRRKLRGGALVLAWALRVYVVFMMLVVVWQAWIAVR